MVSGTTPLITSSAISRRLAGGDLRLVGGELLLVVGDRRIEVGGQVAAHAALELGAQLGAGRRRGAFPSRRASWPRAVPASAPGVEDVGRDLEGRVVPSRAPCARRRSRRRRAASRGPCWCRPWSARRSRWWSWRRSGSGGRSACAASMAPAIASGSWPSMRDACSSPTPAKRATWSVESASEIGAVDGDVVVVPEDDQLVELEVAGERDAPPG